MKKRILYVVIALIFLGYGIFDLDQASRHGKGIIIKVVRTYWTYHYKNETEFIKIFLKGLANENITEIKNMSVKDAWYLSRDLRGFHELLGKVDINSFTILYASEEKKNGKDLCNVTVNFGAHKYQNMSFTIEKAETGMLMKHFQVDSDVF